MIIPEVILTPLRQALQKRYDEVKAANPGLTAEQIAAGSMCTVGSDLVIGFIDDHLLFMGLLREVVEVGGADSADPLVAKIKHALTPRSP